jgi:hypothetical protein
MIEMFQEISSVSTALLNQMQSLTLPLTKLPIHYSTTILIRSKTRLVIQSAVHKSQINKINWR